MGSEAIDFLLSVPMFQQIGIDALNPSLDKITEIDRLLGSPHNAFRVIHVGGTNGKGSVSHMIASVLAEAGFRVGLYTSPHLVHFTERIRVDGVPVEESFVERFVERVCPLIERLNPSFFEITTALAFDYFKAKAVDYAVVEVGLGGKFDATNIVTPQLSVITNISKDHMAILGNTIREIAEQKAGIIKPAVPVVVGESDREYDDLFTAASEACGSELVFADKRYRVVGSLLTSDSRRFEIQDGDRTVVLDCELRGEAQKKNVLTVFAALQKLGIAEQCIAEGLCACATKTGLQGRWQTLNYEPLVICDTAHNEAGIREVVAQLAALPYKKLWIILGMVADKDVSSVLSLLPQEAHYFFTRASVPRSLSETEMGQKAAKASLKGEECPSVMAAMARAKELAGPGDVVFIGGSNFIVADALVCDW